MQRHARNILDRIEEEEDEDLEAECTMFGSHEWLKRDPRAYSVPPSKSLLDKEGVREIRNESGRE